MSAPHQSSRWKRWVNAIDFMVLALRRALTCLLIPAFRDVKGGDIHEPCITRWFTPRTEMSVEVGLRPSTNHKNQSLQGSRLTVSEKEEVS